MALSPDGLTAAAVTTSAQVHVFNGPFGASLSPAENWSFHGVNASSVAISNSGPEPGGGALVAMGLGSTLSVYPADSKIPYFNYSAWNVPGISPTYFVRDVAISDDGTVVTALVTTQASGLSGFEFAYFHDGSLTYALNYTNTEPISLSMDTDGSWAIVGAQGAESTIYVFSSTGFSGEWYPSAPENGPAEDLTDVAIAGDGNYMYEVGVSGIFEARVSPITQIGYNTNASAGLQTLKSVATSFNGTQVIGGLAYGADYWNLSAPGASLAQPVWSATYQNPVVNVTIAAGAPNYFTVSDSTTNTLSWFYLYPNMPSGGGAGAQAYYRQITATGAIHSVAQSYDEQTTVMGSAYDEQGTNEEFILAEDGGIQGPSQPVVSVEPITPSPGDTTASLNITWSAPGTDSGVTSIKVAVNLTNPSQGGNLFAGPVTLGAGATYYLAKGLSFSTNYTVTVTFQAYGGARNTPSVAEVVKTAGAPPVQDPFLLLEITALGLLIVGVIVAVLANVKDRKPASDRPSRRKMAEQPAEQLPPGFR